MIYGNNEVKTCLGVALDAMVGARMDGELQLGPTVALNKHAPGWRLVILARRAPAQSPGESQRLHLPEVGSHLVFCRQGMELPVVLLLLALY